MLADDAGQIDYFKYEELIKLSQITFAFPLIKIIGSVKTAEQLIVLYITNLILLTWVVLLIIFALKKIRNWRKKPAANIS